MHRLPYNLIDNETPQGGLGAGWRRDTFSSDDNIFCQYALTTLLASEENYQFPPQLDLSLLLTSDLHLHHTFFTSYASDV